jgi:hypothetical protein
MTAKQIVDHLRESSLELAALKQDAAQLTALGRYTAATDCDVRITALEETIRQEAYRLVAAGGWRPQRKRTYTVALRLLGITL